MRGRVVYMRLGPRRRAREATSTAKKTGMYHTGRCVRALPVANRGVVELWLDDDVVPIATVC